MFIRLSGHIRLFTRVGIEIRNIVREFRLFMFVYWAMILSVTGMYTMYIVQMGFTKKEIGVAVTISTFSALAGQIFIGYLVDRYKCKKRIFLLATSVGLFVSLALAFFREIWQIDLLLFLWGFFIFGTVPFSETWCIDKLNARNAQQDFGLIRGIGSIGYGLSGVLIGLLLEYLGWRIYHWYILISVICTLLAIYLIREDREDNQEYGREGETCGKISFREGIAEISKVKPLRYMVIVIFFYAFVVNGIYAYLGVLLADYGGGALSLGLTYFFDATPEVITFFIAKRLLGRFQSKSLIFIAFLLQIIRLALILLIDTSSAIMLFGMLEGLSFGLLAASYKTFIYEFSPERYKTSCMSLCESIIGFSGILGAPVFGFIIVAFGGSAAIFFGLVINVVSALFLILNKATVMDKGGKDKCKDSNPSWL